MWPPIDATFPRSLGGHNVTADIGQSPRDFRTAAGLSRLASYRYGPTTGGRATLRNVSDGVTP